MLDSSQKHDQCPFLMLKVIGVQWKLLSDKDFVIQLLFIYFCDWKSCCVSARPFNTVTVIG